MVVNEAFSKVSGLDKLALDVVKYLICSLKKECFGVGLFDILVEKGTVIV